MWPGYLASARIGFGCGSTSLFRVRYARGTRGKKRKGAHDFGGAPLPALRANRLTLERNSG